MVTFDYNDVYTCTWISRPTTYRWPSCSISWSCWKPIAFQNANTSPPLHWASVTALTLAGRSAAVLPRSGLPSWRTTHLRHCIALDTLHICMQMQSRVLRKLHTHFEARRAAQGAHHTLTVRVHLLLCSISSEPWEKLASCCMSRNSGCVSSLGGPFIMTQCCSTGAPGRPAMPSSSWLRAAACCVVVVPMTLHSTRRLGCCGALIANSRLPHGAPASLIRQRLACWSCLYCMIGSSVSKSRQRSAAEANRPCEAQVPGLRQ